jgi:hypothetical protein
MEITNNYVRAETHILSTNTQSQPSNSLLFKVAKIVSIITIFSLLLTIYSNFANSSSKIKQTLKENQQNVIPRQLDDITNYIMEPPRNETINEDVKGFLYHMTNKEYRGKWYLNSKDNNNDIKGSIFEDSNKSQGSISLNIERWIDEYLSQKEYHFMNIKLLDGDYITRWYSFKFSLNFKNNFTLTDTSLSTSKIVYLEYNEELDRDINTESKINNIIYSL